MNKKALLFFLIGVSSAFCLGWVMNTPETLVIYNNTVQVVEVPVIVTDTITLIDKIEVPFPVYVNNTEIFYVPTPLPLIDFPSESVLLAWIYSDKTDIINYEDRWNCMDFTLRTIRNAEIDGYRVYFLLEWIDEEDTHALCMAYVKDEAKYIIWEPQSDVVEWEWVSNRGG